jgi:hypothetical protein
LFFIIEKSGEKRLMRGWSSSKVWNSAILFVTLHCDSEEKKAVARLEARKRIKENSKAYV